MVNKKEFGKRLRQAREQKSGEDKKFTQEQLAIKLNISKQSISDYERGQKLPPVDVITSLADELSVSVDWLLCRDGKEGNTFDFNKYSGIARMIVSLQDIYFSVETEHIDADHDEFYNPVLERTEYFECSQEKNIVILKCDDKCLFDFFQKETKMHDLLREGTITDDLFNTWLNAEIEKLD